MMGTAELQGIPKIIVGNPTVADTAYDFVPNYRPQLTSHVAKRNGMLTYDDSELPLPTQDYFALASCDGTKTVMEIVASFSRRFGVALEESTPQVFAIMKRARSLNLVNRDNSLASNGLIVRIRKLKTTGEPSERSLYLPPLAQRVLALCSGSFSCREIIGTISAETNEWELRTLQRDVPEICRLLERERIIAWIDDEPSREARLAEFIGGASV